MKKVLFALLIVTVMISVNLGVCIASENNDGPEGLTTNDSVICVQEYPQLGFKANSWITGAGGETIAHTQITTATGVVIKQIDVKCNYTNNVVSTEM